MKIKKVNKELHIFFIVILVGSLIMIGSSLLFPSTSKAQSPHANYLSDTELCVMCHNTHAAITTNLLNNGKDFQTDLCYACHNGTGARSIYNIEQAFDGNSSHHPIKDSYYTANPDQAHSVDDAHTNADYAVNCTTCHNPHGDKDSLGNYYPKLLHAEDKQGNPFYQGNEFCGVCHGPDSLPLLVGGDHLTPVPHNLDPKMPDPLSGTKIKCLNCHGNTDSLGAEGKAPHGSDSPRLTLANEEILCFICHNNPLNSQNSINIQERLSYYNTTASNTKIPSPIYQGIYTAQHNVTDADQVQTGSKVECKNCHNPHLNDRADKVVDPDKLPAYDTSALFSDTAPDPFDPDYSSVVIRGTSNIQDTKIKSGSTTPQEVAPGDTNANPTNDKLIVGQKNTSPAGLWRTLIKFNLTSIPPNATIKNAYLILGESDGADAGNTDLTFNFYPLTEDWSESTATWFKRNGVDNWSTAGGTYDSATVATKNLIGAWNWNSWENFDVTNLVSGWYQGQFANNGMIAISSSTSGYRSYFSSEEIHATVSTPSLVVRYKKSAAEPAPSVQDTAGFCLKCHDGNAPASVTMPLGLKNIGPPSLNLLYPDPLYLDPLYGEWHGAKASPGDVRGLSSLFSPYYAGMPALPCTECHDPHGSSNIFHLKENIRGRIVTVTDTTPASIRTFCQACHNLQLPGKPPQHGLTETRSCFDCHYHRGKFEENANPNRATF